MKSKKRVLIISTGAGGGHIKAAEAVAAGLLDTDQEGRFDVLNIDVLDYTNFVFKKIYAKSYLAMVNHLPSFWGYAYRQMEHNETAQKVAEVRKLLSAVNGIRLFELIKKFEPDYILHTHFLSCEILSQRKKYRDLPQGVVITDYDMHNFWIHPHIKHYFVASAEVAWGLERKGIEKKRIVVTGIPVRKAFQLPFDRSVLENKFNFHGDETRILLLGGGFGVGLIREAVQSIQSLPFTNSVRVIVSCGKNKSLKKNIEKIEFPRNIKKTVLGFVDNLDEYMKVTDVAIGKAGGLTVSESLSVGLPLIIIAPIPGQEERNTEYLLEQGAALKADNIFSLEYKLLRLINEPDLRNRLKKNCLAIAPKGSVARIIQQISSTI